MNSVGNLWATGQVLVQTGQSGGGQGFVMIDSASVLVDQSGGFGLGAGTLGDTLGAADGLIQIRSDGDVKLRGSVQGLDSGSGISVMARGQVFVGGLVRAISSVSIAGGSNASKLGVVIDNITITGTTSTGGTVDTADGGSIAISATDGILIQGVLGQTASAGRAAPELDLGRGRVKSVSVASTSGNVTLLRNIYARDHVVMTGTNISLLAGSYVYASTTDALALNQTSDVYINARNVLTVSAAPTVNPTGSNDAIIKGDALVHLVAQSMQIDGTVQVTNQVSGRVLLNAGKTITTAGFITSGKDIALNAGVDLSWDRTRLEGVITREQLLGGSITVHGQALLNAKGTLSLQAGGDVLVDGEPVAPRTTTITTINTTSELVPVITGYHQEAAGTVDVPVITTTKTEITVQLPDKEVVTGHYNYEFDVALSQSGYWNPTKSNEADKFREVLVEGVDYHNDQINWANASDEQNPGRSADAGTNNPVSDYHSTKYKTFQQLNDAQRWAVLNSTGYKPLYDFSYGAATTDASGNVTGSVANKVWVNKTENGSVTKTMTTPTWAAATQQVFKIDVANWRDKYVLMPTGANNDILNLISQGNAQYLTGDTSLDGTNSGASWVTNAAGATGELVGTYKDTGNVKYEQVTSAFSNPSDGVDYDGQGAKWLASYNGGGTRIYSITGNLTGVAADQALTSSTVNPRDPNWSWVSTSTGWIYQTTPVNDYTAPANTSAIASVGTRSTNAMQSTADYYTALTSATASLTEKSSYTTRYNVEVGWAYGNGSVTFYKDYNYSGATSYYTAGTDWVGSTVNDTFSALQWTGTTKKVVAYEHKGYGGTAWTFDASAQPYPSGWADKISAVKVYGYRYENYSGYNYSWTSTDTKVYDQRIKLSYHLVTNAKEITNKVPNYETRIVDVETVQFQKVTVWKSVPTIEYKTQLKSEATTLVTGGVVYGGFAGETLSAATISVNAGGSVQLSGGALKAANVLSITAGNLLQAQGTGVDSHNAPKSVTLTGGSQLNLSSGQNLQVDDSVVLNVTGVAATLNLKAGNDLFLGGSTTAAGAGASILLQAGSDLSVSGAVLASSVVLNAGASTAGDGAISTDAQTTIEATAGNLTLTAGRYGGGIQMSDSTLKASAGVSLVALNGAITQTRKDLVDSNGVIQSTPSGLISAQSLNVSGDNGIDLNTKVATATLKLAASGDISLRNLGDLTLSSVSAFDGGITVYNQGNLLAASVLALGTSDRNDIDLSAYVVGTTGSASISLGSVSSAQRGDLLLQADGSISMVDTTSLATADTLQAKLRGPLSLRTNINALSATTSQAGDITVNQNLAGARKLSLTQVLVSDGNFTLDAGNSVDVIDLRLGSNADLPDGNVTPDISITAAGDIRIASLNAGLYLAPGSAKLAVRNSGNTADITLDEVTSNGDVYLNSTGGAVLQRTSSAVPNLVADRLTVLAATGITGLLTAINSLDAVTTTGNISLSDIDGAWEKSPGLDVIQAVTAKSAAGGANNTVTLVAQGGLRVGSWTAGLAPNAGAIVANTIHLESQTGSVLVAAPAGYSTTTLTPNTLDYDRGVIFIAHNDVSLYRFFEAPDWMEYRAGGVFTFGVPGSNLTSLLPASLSSDTLILESSSTLSLSGTLSAGKRLELISGQDVRISGSITARTGSAIGELLITARGATQSQTFIDVNKTLGATPTAAQIAALTVLSDTGFIDIQTAALPAANFQLRAKNDVFLQVSDNLSLSGFVGGLSGFDPARNVTINVLGAGHALKLKSGIVAASQTTASGVGLLQIKATSITADGASVFIADQLEVSATNGAQLNTLVRTVKVDSTVSGDVSINEATDLIVEHVVANAGNITIQAAGAMTAKDVRNVADGNFITINAGKNLTVGHVEAATSVGTQKSAGAIVTVDSAGVIDELYSAVDVIRPLTGVHYTDYGQTHASLYGYAVHVYGATAAVPVQLLTQSSTGTGTLDLQVLTTGAGASYVRDLQTHISKKQANQAGGAEVTVNVTVTTPPGQDSKQVSVVEYGSAPPASGYIYTVTVNAQTYVTTVDGTLVAATWEAVLADLKAKIQAGNTPAVIAAGKAIDVSYDSTMRQLTLTGRTANKTFTLVVDANAVTMPIVQPVDEALKIDGAGPLVAPGFLQLQVSDVSFASGYTPAVGYVHSVTINGAQYSARVGENALINIQGSGAVSDLPVSVSGHGPVVGASDPVIGGTGGITLAHTALKGWALDLSGLEVRNGATYTVVIGSGASAATFSYTAAASGATLADIAAGLASAIKGNGSYSTTTSVAQTVSNTWFSVLNALASQVNASEKITATVSASSLHLVGKDGLTAFAVNGAGVTQASSITGNGTVLQQAPDATHPQQNLITFAGAVVATQAYSVTVNGKNYAVRPSGTNDFLTLSTGADDLPITVEVVDANNGNAIAATGLSGIRATSTNTSLPRTVELTGLAFTIGDVVVLKIGENRYTYQTVTGDTLTKVATALAAQINADSFAGFTASSSTLSVSASWNSVLNSLQTLIQADGQLNVTPNVGNQTLLLAAKVNNGKFTLNGVAVAPVTALTADPVRPITPAGHDAFQVSQVVYADPASLTKPYTLGNGYSYTVTVNGHAYSAVVGSAGVTADWASILGTLASKITAGESAITTSYHVSASGQYPALSLTMTAKVKNTAFPVSSATVNLASSLPVVNAVLNNGATPTTSIGRNVAQVLALTFPSTLSADSVYTVSIGSANYAVKIGDNVSGYGAVSNSWASLLGALEAKINADSGRVVNAVASTSAGNQLVLTALTVNKAFSASASGSSQTAASALSVDGDYVLIVPDQPAGDYGMVVHGNLTVVDLPTSPAVGGAVSLSALSGTSGAGGNLVIVSPLNVGKTGGSITLTASASLTVGSTVTASSLTVTAGDDLTLKTDVGTMTITLTQAGDLTIISDSGHYRQHEQSRCGDAQRGGGHGHRWQRWPDH
ncbi:MAG: hypothetical protein NTZ64_15900 [Polaromonas sp.]|nr:hypothetical protein [Polaromonas sp.]